PAEGAPVRTGPQFPPTQQTSPGPGGRGTALLIGGITFAVVFLLVVGATVTFLVFRSGGGGESGAGGAPVSESASATEAGTGSPEESASPTPPDVEPARCWTPDRERTSSSPSGKLRGGGLQFIPPAVYDQRGNPSGIAYANDLQGAQALVEDSWYSTTFVGKVEWQPGIEYPGAEVASQMIADCMFYANIWGDTQGRSLDEDRKSTRLNSSHVSISYA